MNPELEVLKMVAKRLESRNIPYMITGSVAMNFYAVPRMTREIDMDGQYFEKWVASLGLREVYARVKR